MSAQKTLVINRRGTCAGWDGCPTGCRAQKCATAIDRHEMDAVEQMRADDIVFRAAA